MGTLVNKGHTNGMFKSKISMKNQLNKHTENFLRLSVLERMRQLEKKDPDIDLIQRESEYLEMIDELILYANSAPHGQVEIVFMNKDFTSKAPIEKKLLHSRYKVSAFNVKDPESYNTLMRTVILIDPKWSCDFDVYHCQYGYGDSHLKKK